MSRWSPKTFINTRVFDFPSPRRSLQSSKTREKIRVLEHLSMRSLTGACGNGKNTYVLERLDTPAFTNNQNTCVFELAVFVHTEHLSKTRHFRAIQLRRHDRSIDKRHVFQCFTKARAHRHRPELENTRLSLLSRACERGTCHKYTCF